MTLSYGAAVTLVKAVDSFILNTVDNLTMDNQSNKKNTSSNYDKNNNSFFFSLFFY